ncbi:MAG TPA: hypothetical protein VK852_04835, partial [Desulfobacterales bacterium]|nr:hypothetical protein [Desulfobacterales bacterium]
MGEWNLIATAHENGFRRCRELLQRFGPVARTRYFNVLVLLVAEIPLSIDRMPSWPSKPSGAKAACR